MKFSIALAQVFIILWPGFVFGLDCSRSGGFESAFKQASSVFTARVLSRPDVEHATLQVILLYKGERKEKTQVKISAWDDTLFRMGEELLIFAEEKEGFFSSGIVIDICVRTRELAEAMIDLKALNSQDTYQKTKQE